MIQRIGTGPRLRVHHVGPVPRSRTGAPRSRTGVWTAVLRRRNVLVMRAARHGKRDGGMDSALWALIIASVVLAVLWYRNGSEARRGADALSRPTASSTPPAPRKGMPPPEVPPAPRRNEWDLTQAETVIPNSHRVR